MASFIHQSTGFCVTLGEVLYKKLLNNSCERESHQSGYFNLSRCNVATSMSSNRGPFAGEGRTSWYIYYCHWGTLDGINYGRRWKSISHDSSRKRPNCCVFRVDRSTFPWISSITHQIEWKLGIIVTKFVIHELHRFKVENFKTLKLLIWFFLYQQYLRIRNSFRFV